MSDDTAQALSGLIWRINRLEEAAKGREPEGRFETAKVTFEHILDVVEHMDSKASRILGAMAFLTAAAAAIFAKVATTTVGYDEAARKLTVALEHHQPNLAPADQALLVQRVAQDLSLPQISVFGHNAATLAFVAYMTLVVIGSAFYLITLGPHLRLAPYRRRTKPQMPPVHVPTGNSGPPESKVPILPSLLFWELIGKLSEAQWTEHWKDRSAEELEQEMRQDFVKEAHVLSVKLREKDKFMSVGSLCFRLALIALAGVAAGLFSSSPGLYWSVTTMTVSFLAVIYAATDLIRDRDENLWDAMGWIVLALVFITSGFLLGTGRIG